MLSKEILTKVANAKDAKELQAMARELGYELTDAKAKEIFAMLDTVLTDEELDKVAGGSGCSYCTAYEEYGGCPSKCWMECE